MSVTDYAYFDNNATIPMTTRAIDIFSKVSHAGNISSGNPIANYWRTEANKFEGLIRDGIGASEKDYELLWTSGSTESNCTVVDMFTVNNQERRAIICSSIEHKCLLQAVRQAEMSGTMVVWINPQEDGTILPDDVRKAIDYVYNINPDYPIMTLVTIMHANNETGAINDLDKISRIIHGYKSMMPIFFYSDCAQTFGKIKIRVSSVDFYMAPGDQVYLQVDGGFIRIMSADELEDYAHQSSIILLVNRERQVLHPKRLIDGICFSGHKFGGPTGIGSLIISREFLGVRSFIPITGAQNYGLRGGTYNISGIMSMREAYVDMIINHGREVQGSLSGKSRILDGLRNNRIPVIRFIDYIHLGQENRPSKCLVYFMTRDPKDTLPGTLYCSIVYNNCSHQICNVSLKKYFEKNGIILSIGSACNSATKGMSHVLEAMNCPYEVALGILRISSYDNSSRDYDTLLSALLRLYSKIDDVCIKK